MKLWLFTRRAASVLAASAALCACAVVYGQTISVWQADVCDKIFPETPAGEETPIRFKAAGNEYESAQIGLRSDAALDSVKLEISSLTGVEQNGLVTAENLRIREVGTIHIEHNTPSADSIVTLKAPGDVPEILYDRSTFALPKDESRSAWITLFVPPGTPSGNYAGTLKVVAGDLVKEIPVELEVFPFQLSDKRSLYATNWWSPGNIAVQHKVDFLSEEYWTILEKYLQDMDEHYQNVLHVYWVPGDFVKASIREDGSWDVTFENLDRLLDLALKHHVLDRIELNHIGGIDRTDHVVSFRGVTVYDARKKENVSLGIDEWLPPVLKALCDHLRERDLFDRAMIHIADEPYQPDVDSWREASNKVRAIEPKLKQIDAIEAIHFEDCLDVWVPKLSHFDRWRSAFEARRDKGEFWYYICCHPFGETYPNRFIDLPGVRVRALHWLNYTEDLVGYLHWGYNYWQGDPFGPPARQWGPGDSHVVYPGDGGPLDSIRWEIERESVEDFEYLKLLEAKTSALKQEFAPEKTWFIEPKSRAMEIARRVLPSVTTSTLDVNVVNKARMDAVNEIKNLTGPVKLFVQTYPADGATVFVGPTLFEIYGVTTPGATVTINGDPVEVDKEGFFKSNPDLPVGENTLEFVATLDGKTAKTTRRFTVK